MNKEETLAFINKQIAMELKIIEIVKENVEQLGNAFVKDLLIGISTDSQKHAALLKSLRKAVEGPTPFISEQERDKIAKGIAAHIKMEEEAVEKEKLANDEYEGSTVLPGESELKDVLEVRRFLLQIFRLLFYHSHKLH